MKLFLWIWTSVGILPLFAFSALHAYSAWQLRRARASESHDELGENEFVITISEVQFDGMTDPMVVSPSAWPALASLAGISLTLAGLLFLIPKQPLRIKTNVYERLPTVIDRIVNSKKDPATLIVSARDGNRALSVSKRDQRIEIGLSHNLSESQEISEIRGHFRTLGIEPTHDYETYDDHFDITTVHLEYDITDHAPETSKFCEFIFRDVYSIGSNETVECDIDD
ncbi:hypothetical protein Mal15_48010 [Stieleria maiorica]|uniref:Uncharacterized protein n=1 Tax=Stieleria maiorica TaxID=2795974 RepID=A0A5B9MHX3_9BACT|nr:hypothetical protein [Stieleria maiorica]QEG00729.1 hypothetical protein Mal15_48010 [Stieleria maiorica]